MDINFKLTDVKRQYRTPSKEKGVVGAHGSADTIRIHWDIITICDLHCSYCYARALEEWHNIPSKDKLDIHLENIKNIDKEVEVVLLGGEPTLSPSYFYLLDQLNTYPNIVSVAILSNAQKKFTPDWVAQHQKYKNFFFNITYHPNDSDIKKTKDAILLCDRNQLVVNIIMLGPKFDLEISEMIDFCLMHEVTVKVNIPFHPFKNTQFAKSSPLYKNWISKFADKFERYLYFELTSGETFVLNDIDVYLNDLNKFKGWQCSNNNWEIGINSKEIKRTCKGPSVEGSMTCVLAACTCQGLLSAEKYNTNN